MKRLVTFLIENTSKTKNIPNQIILLLTVFRITLILHNNVFVTLELNEHNILNKL